MGLGQTLREARQKHNLTASQVAAGTRMKVQIVEDLEREEFAKIAAPIYGKGFIKLYAEYVGLDAKPLIEEYVARFVSPPTPSLKATDARRVRRPEPLPDPAEAPADMPQQTEPAGTEAPASQPAASSPALTTQSEPAADNDFFSHLRTPAEKTDEGGKTDQVDQGDEGDEGDEGEKTDQGDEGGKTDQVDKAAPQPPRTRAPAQAPPPLKPAAPEKPMDEPGASRWSELVASVGGGIKRGATRTRDGLVTGGKTLHQRVIAPVGTGIRKGTSAIVDKTRNARSAMGRTADDRFEDAPEKPKVVWKRLDIRWMSAGVGILLVLVLAISALSRCGKAPAVGEGSGGPPGSSLRLAKEPPAPYLD
jgi:transcriptional regulator with XRE-family HTH domain